MLRPLELPEGAPELARKRAAEWALGTADVALLCGVSKQSAYEWARGGRVTEEGLRTVLPSLRAPGGKQEPLRFRLTDVETFAKDHHLEFEPYNLPLVLQRRLRVGAYGAADGLIEDRLVVEDELISESAAARELGIGRSLLQKKRSQGKLNPAIRIEGSSYSQLDIWKVVDGELELELPPG